VTHFPRCPHIQRRQSWTAFIPTISSVMERWYMDPSLRRILLHLIVPLTTLHPILLTNLNDEYVMLLATHRSIGEDSLLFGLMPMEWLRLQDHYLRTLGLPRSQREASRAIRSLIMLIHDQCQVVWLLRNQHLHGTDPFKTTSYKHMAFVKKLGPHKRPRFEEYSSNVNSACLELVFQVFEPLFHRCQSSLQSYHRSGKQS
jgi:hypothetical protein